MRPCTESVLRRFAMRPRRPAPPQGPKVSWQPSRREELTRPWLSFRHSTESQSATVAAPWRADCSIGCRAIKPAGGAEDMAKQRKLLLSLRSAETLGRVIGTLHRQLDGAMRRVTGHRPPGSSPASSSQEEKPASSSRRARPRLAASADPSPSRHPRKTVTGGRGHASRTAKKTVKRTARPK